MFYHLADIREIMTDVVLEQADEKMHSSFKNRMGYFMRGADRIATSADFPAAVKPKEMEGTKGNLSDALVRVPIRTYSFRGSDVTLSALDNSFEMDLK